LKSIQDSLYHAVVIANNVAKKFFFVFLKRFCCYSTYKRTTLGGAKIPKFLIWAREAKLMSIIPFLRVRYSIKALI